MICDCSHRRLVFATLFLALLQFEQSLQAQTIRWNRQLGSESLDESFGVSADGMGNVYITGITGGSLSPDSGTGPAFVSKFNSAGAVQWTRQFGQPDTYVRPNGVSADKQGNIFIAGTAEGLLGEQSAGGSDAFLAKYDTSGNLQWISQLGSTQSDYSFGVSADGLGNVYITGITTGNLAAPNAGPLDAFLAKYDSAGTHQWSRQFGTNRNDEGIGVSADALGNIFVSGYTRGSLGGPNAGIDDAYISKFDASGTHIWSQQFGTESIDRSFGVAADGQGNVYMSGETPHNGNMDAFVNKYDANGILLWTTYLGSGAFDTSYAVASDHQGNAYVSGMTETNLTPNQGRYDAYLGKIDPAGNFLWSINLGTSSFDVGRGVSADERGGIYVTGAVGGSLDWGLTDGVDAFLTKVQDVPEPSLAIYGIGLWLAFPGRNLFRR